MVRADAYGGTTISLTEHTGDRVMLMTEWGEWRPVRLPRTPTGVAERTYTFLANSPWALASATAYDVFAFLGSDGCVDIERGPAWASATARASALARLDGANVLGINPTRLYVGTIYAGTNTIDDSVAKRHLWNMHNRVPRIGTGSFSADRTTTSTTVVEINSEIRCTFVLGLAEDAVLVIAAGAVSTSLVANVQTGIGIDGTTISQQQSATPAGANYRHPVGLSIPVSPGIGLHYATLLGYVDGSTATWYSSDTNISAKTRLLTYIRM